jgi:MOSC domain
VLADGTEIIDVHNVSHPQSRNGGANGISVGFTAHYAAMRAHFGAHLSDGIAGENILVETASTIKLSDLGKRLVFQNQAGTFVYLDNLLVAPPCEPFSRFALRQSPPVEAATMKATLQFLDDGTRGFYAVPLSGTIQSGDKVFASDDN